jgi:hypothetical protein
MMVGVRPVRMIGSSARADWNPDKHWIRVVRELLFAWVGVFLIALIGVVGAVA